MATKKVWLAALAAVGMAIGCGEGGGGSGAAPSAQQKSMAQAGDVGSSTIELTNTFATEAVVNGLAMHIDELGKPLCPCNFYQDKQAEAKLRRWICACDEMQVYKYCHCLLFVREDGMPITEYLPEGHEGREVYGVVTDPTPDKGRALKHKAVPSSTVPDESPATSASPT